MSKRFDYFVVFAEMRTGSNFLEANLNAFPALSCLGEAFNPHFIGYPNREECLGVGEEARNRDPQVLIDAVKHARGLAGFRFFHDHEPRVLETILTDPRCAKIVLTRNPVESYVSWKIAQETGQWKLTNVAKRKDAQARFDAREFTRHLEALQAFQLKLMKRLQTTGQTAFYVAYEDLQDVEVMNGLAAFLEQPDRLERLDRNLKRQNPEPLSAKVANFEEMEAALAKTDHFGLGRTPNFEARRGAAIPSYVACARAPLLFLPLRAAPEEEILSWMAELDGVSTDELQRDFKQKTLRQWMRNSAGHRSFTVVRHPALRAHRAFCEHILNKGPKCFSEIRRTLRRVHRLPIPQEGPDDSWTVAAHRRAFLAYLDFVKANLSDQTAVRHDAAWSTQAAILQGMAQFALPDFILREEELEAYLPALGLQVGVQSEGALPQPEPETPFTLADIYDAEVEARVAEAYQRDYLVFGFGSWK
ncbi:sulfotransferase family 2 domain-containing protein [uncultured Lentibacter sp.]|uniref:sulfotransferase family 2 domain-containing protein n=1 Tax=uncultured Lentibacter sp. TaxID=1659309 RepID=UPI0026127E38|nr:sulfotransferase family 2 domain-containing protein [uncultured Lentibacter sp.]